MKQAATLSTAVETAATKAVFVLQYNTNRAAQFICAEVPRTSFEDAVKAIDTVARPSKVKVTA